MEYRKWSQYWKNSLSDAESQKGILKKEEIGKTLIQVGQNCFKTGQLDMNVVPPLFSDLKDDIDIVAITYRPSIFHIKTEHTSRNSSYHPETISLLSCPVLVNREGRLFPTGEVAIPRDLLTPLYKERFTVGTVESLDNYFTKHCISSFTTDDVKKDYFNENHESYPEMWERYRSEIEDLYRSVCTEFKPSSSECEYRQANYGLIERSDSIKGASRYIQALYDSIRRESNTLPLFKKYSIGYSDTYEDLKPFQNTISLRKGHSNENYALADAQRDALSHALSMEEGDILAVNGPPGTGKTTFVLSVVASMWIDAAIKKTTPPVIVASSTNNQAVTNIIEAFGKDFSEGNSKLSGRWLPEVTSYGAYFPSQKKLEEAEKLYQTNNFYNTIETVSYYRRANSYFMEKARSAFPNLSFETLEDVQETFHEELVRESRRLKEIEKCWNELEYICERVHEVLGDNPEETIDSQSMKIKTVNTSLSNIDKDILKIKQYTAEEPLFLHLFSWIPAIRSKRTAQRNLFIESSLSSVVKKIVSFIPFEEMLHTIEAHRDTLINHRRELTLINENFKELIRNKELSQKRWSSIVQDIGIDSPKPDISAVDKKADITIRFNLFRLAVHYWEAEWLLTMKKDGGQIEASTLKTGLNAVIPRWYRRMMITPCIVSTFHSLPGHMTHTVYNEGDFDKEYLYNFIDLLIVDEAGQVSPEVAGASFSLAKRCLAIGDIHQIEPVRSLRSSVDIGNLQESSLIKNSDQYDKILSSFRSAVNGSVMLIAQQNSRYRYLKTMEPGMYLQEHRRCFDEIISYCNELSYKGALIPMRGSSSGALFPPFAHLHIDGKAQTGSSGSQLNNLEAHTIAHWLAENRSSIEQCYGIPLEEAVGIITPFSAQTKAINTACKKVGITVGKVDNAITVGTVHALQGAERPIIIFSQVYSRHNNGRFIDSSTSMLNVAVSRAKDSFLVFGDMELISTAPPSTPRGLLSRYLFNTPDQELVVKTLKRDDLVKQNIHQVITNAAEHDAFIIKNLNSAKEKISIVSPWIKFTTMRESGIFDAMKQATKRNVNIEIFTDKHFNTTKNNRKDTKLIEKLHQCRTSLLDEGISLHVINGVHSKLVMTDNDSICIGSYNWLSAVRRGKYANMETSVIYTGDVKDEIKIQLMYLKKRITNS